METGIRALSEVIVIVLSLGSEIREASMFN